MPLKIRAHPLFASERLRHAAIAMVVVLLLASMRFLAPIDITIWALQTKLFEQASAGDVAYVDLNPQGETQAEAAASLMTALTCAASPTGNFAPESNQIDASGVPPRSLARSRMIDEEAIPEPPAALASVLDINIAACSRACDGMSA